MNLEKNVQDKEKVLEKRKLAEDFQRKLFSGGFRDQDKGIEGGHRNPRPKRNKKKAQRNNNEHQNTSQSE
jgi:hypothetical protein